MSGMMCKRTGHSTRSRRDSPWNGTSHHVVVILSHTENRKRKGKLLLKTEEISGRKAHTNTPKLNWNVLTITDVFLNQMRVNLFEHMVKTGPCESFEKLVALFKNSHMAVSLPCVHIHLLSSDRERHMIVEISQLSTRVFVRRSFHFPVRVFPFFFLFF